MHNALLHEQTAYTSSFRMFVSPKNEAKFYTRNQSLTLKEIATFDAKASTLSSVELFVASFMSSYLFTLKKEAKKENILLDELEARFTCTLENPLTLLNVIGFEDEAAIKSLQGDIFIYSEAPSLALHTLCQNALKKSLLYKLLNTQCIDISITPKIVTL